ncbi:hypothetical protein PFICI_04820 [Pestalotiopsis fici W106-1]|uniref:Clathrin/coatomer adaptor adaptin-like N-terminal domain-containing protein n=1 Tax=Pestalotiopsis fici (strain W106-1 / CGMCC3.15140) TaxID=1229662 RepID=W3XA88_PESFW|nr:uncharacterized protein PFICI_04820 [Pestalotiopsis fici W106-1]ETS82944.1 hypothetical protein PFICI_04820 [Pestalotiopsis fici W106-1]
MSIEAIHMMCCWLSDDADFRRRHDLKRAIFAILGGQQGNLDDNALNAIIARLEDDDNLVQYEAISTLTKFTALEARVLHAVETQFLDPEMHVSVRCSAIKLLGKQSRLDDQFVDFLVHELQGGRPQIRIACIEALAHHLNDDVLQSITTRLNDTTEYVRDAALEVLRSQPQRSNDVFQKMIALLDRSEEVFGRRHIVESLGVWPQSEDGIFNVIKTQLDHENNYVRIDVLRALENWSQISDKILDIVAVQLEHHDCYVRSQAIKTLGSRRQLDHSVLDAIKTRARVDNEEALEEAIRALITHSQVDDDTRDIIIARLHDEDASNRSAVLKAVCFWSAPDVEVVDLVVAHLKDDQWNVSVQIDALCALRAWPQLNDTVLCTIADKLGDRDNAVEDQAAMALMNRPQPKGNAMKAIARRLMDKRGSSLNVLRTLLQGLVKWPELDGDVLCAIAGLFGFDKGMAGLDHIICRLFRNQPQPANEVIKAIMVHHEHDSSWNRLEALQALGTWTRLDIDTLLTIATHLEDPDSHVQDAAFRVLIKQESPPFVMLEQHIPSLYRISLRISFGAHVYWTTENGKLCIVMGFRKIVWNDEAEESESRSGTDSSLGLQLRQRAPEWLRDFGLGKRES